MQTLGKQLKEITVIEKTMCDKCGKESDINNKNDWMIQFGSLTFNPWYGSPFDMDRWRVDLCEDCFWVVFESIMGFKPNPDEENCHKPGYVGQKF